jgi:hypothetical protein
MTTTRANVLQLIELRASVTDLRLSEATSRKLCAEIIAGDTSTRGLDALRDQLLDVLSRAANELHTDRGRLALWHAIAQIPGDEDRPVEQRQAARLIVWHNLAATARDPERWSNDNVALDSLGVGEFNRVINVINAFDRARETLIAIIDTWLSLLPELTTADVDWLETLMPLSRTKGKTL